MLQIMKDSDLRAAAQNRRRESGVQQNIDTPPGNRQRQNRLLPDDPRGPERGTDTLLVDAKVGLRGSQVAAGFTVGQQNILIRAVDIGERAQQVSQIDLGAAYPSGNQ